MLFFPIPAVKAAHGDTSAALQRPRAGLGSVIPQSSAPSWWQDACVGLVLAAGAPCSWWSWEEAAPGKHRSSLLCPKFRLPAGAHGAWPASGLDHRIHLAIPPEAFCVSHLWFCGGHLTGDPQVIHWMLCQEFSRAGRSWDFASWRETTNPPH